MSSSNPDSTIREFNVLKQICDPGLPLDSRVIVGPGDDLAVMLAQPPGEHADDGLRLLLGVDQLIDGIHLSLADCGLELAGRKAVARSLSDLAAMAARPLATLVSAAVPVSFTDDQAMILFESMKRTAEEYHAPLVGGDLSVHKNPEAPLCCSVTVAGVAPAGGEVTRFGACEGDGIYVTGCLGGAWKGDHHLNFRPRLAEASMLRAILQDRLHAMIDISDGLGQDAGHLVERSSLQIMLDADRIPLREGANLEQALKDGEDYELLFAASGEVPDGLGNCVVTRIGTVTARLEDDAPGVIIQSADGHRDVATDGWEHSA
ncbi:MAG: hypothetical protein CMJ39_05005 [Phycisphaerae bacterium]|nr:hypothetical protein [Phycisphaerae bacterium]|tara:strand:- start:286 stop:1242 length:957 start_codon:yes stop_codon:yes gene_type:complete